MIYIGATIADPEKNDCYQDFIDSSSEAFNNIKINTNEEFNLVTENGDHIVTQAAEPLIAQERKSFEVKFKESTKIEIVLTDITS